jgi:hypothetical protein
MFLAALRCFAHAPRIRHIMLTFHPAPLLGDPTDRRSAELRLSWRAPQLEEIAVEKLVALTGKAWNEPRDLYDLWHSPEDLSDHSDPPRALDRAHPRAHYSSTQPRPATAGALRPNATASPEYPALPMGTGKRAFKPRVARCLSSRFERFIFST